MSYSAGIRPITNSIQEESKHKKQVLFKQETGYSIEFQPKTNTNTNKVIGNGVDLTLLQSFLRAAPDPAITTNAHGQIYSFSKCAEELLGYHYTEVLGRHISDLFNPASDPIDAAIRADLSEKSQWRHLRGRPILYAVRKNEELIPVEVILKECCANNQSFRIYYLKDASLRKRHEQRIAELEREVCYLSQHSVLGELATAIIHELSQPLAAITNYTAAADRYCAQGATQRIEDGVGLIRKAGDQAKRAWQMMHRLRQLVQHKGAEITNADLRLALDDAIELATLGANNHGITASIDVPEHPVVVRMDRIHVQILLANLIRNAVDELRTWSGERKIRIKMSVTDSKMAEVSIMDTGPGIAPEVYENIFDPFLTTKPCGLGVGLAVSRRIALAHGGRLAARNSPDGGATFSFLVPVSESSMSEKVGDE